VSVAIIFKISGKLFIESIAENPSSPHKLVLKAVSIEFSLTPQSLRGKLLLITRKFVYSCKRMNYRNKVFTEAEIKGKNFEEDTFSGCKFLDISFRFANFTSCEFRFCDFTGSFFDIVSFTKCNFPETKLSNFDFSGTQITSCDFSKAVMVNCIFQQLKTGDKNRRKKFSLRKSVFEAAELTSTVFILCNLGAVSFQNAKLKGVVFEKCDLTQADLSGADINGSNFEGSKIGKTKLNLDGFIKFANSKGFILGD